MRGARRSRSARLAWIAVLLSAGLGPGVAGAAGQQFGVPLGTAPFAGAPDNSYDCTQYPTFAGALPVISPSGAGVASSCTWLDTDVANPSWAPTPGALGNVTVDQVRVAVGPTTGPMQVIVLRALYQNSATPGKPIYACCTQVAASQPFTPQANTITAVAVRLPMHEDPTPAAGDLTTIAASDSLGLAVLEDGVPVPLYSTGGAGFIDLLWNTGAPPTVTPGYYSDTAGYAVAMNADWTQAAGVRPRGSLSGAARRGSLLTPRVPGAGLTPSVSSDPLGRLPGAGALPVRGCDIWSALCIGPQFEPSLAPD